MDKLSGSARRVDGTGADGQPATPQLPGLVAVPRQRGHQLQDGTWQEDVPAVSRPLIALCGRPGCRAGARSPITVLWVITTLRC